VRTLRELISQRASENADGFAETNASQAAKELMLCGGGGPCQIHATESTEGYTRQARSLAAAYRVAGAISVEDTASPLATERDIEYHLLVLEVRCRARAL
jgi:hypothetical protein